MRFPRFFSSSLFVLVATTLGACGTTDWQAAAPAGLPPAPQTPRAAVAASSPPSITAPPLRITLASEQGRLAELFRGTPVVFAMQPGGELRATVPRRFSFDAGAAKVKPPLAAVLDRLAKSQLTTGAQMRVAAPADPGGRSTTLAVTRALAVRDYLVGQGVASSRLLANGATQTEQVEIVVNDPAH